jgi:hypothetical protein
MAAKNVNVVELARLNNLLVEKLHQPSPNGNSLAGSKKILPGMSALNPLGTAHRSTVNQTVIFAQDAVEKGGQQPEDSAETPTGTGATSISAGLAGLMGAAKVLRSGVARAKGRPYIAIRPRHDTNAPPLGTHTYIHCVVISLLLYWSGDAGVPVRELLVQVFHQKRDLAAWDFVIYFIYVAVFVAVLSQVNPTSVRTRAYLYLQSCLREVLPCIVAVLILYQCRHSKLIFRSGIARLYIQENLL